MPDSTYKKPLPRINRLSRPYWDGSRRHELLLQRCTACSRYRFPPSERCAQCLSDASEWAPASGRGKVWSWIRMWQRYFPAFDDERPYVVAYIELEEGPRLMSTIVECDPEAIRCDMPVEVTFDDVTDLAGGFRGSCESATLPVLADALEEAGCDDPDILGHCRSTGNHVRGCWVVDLVLGKE